MEETCSPGFDPGFGEPEILSVSERRWLVGLVDGRARTVGCERCCGVGVSVSVFGESGTEADTLGLTGE